MLYVNNNTICHIIFLLAVPLLDYWKCSSFIYTNSINHNCFVMPSTMPQVIYSFHPNEQYYIKLT